MTTLDYPIKNRNKKNFLQLKNGSLTTTILFLYKNMISIFNFLCEKLLLNSQSQLKKSNLDTDQINELIKILTSYFYNRGQHKNRWYTHNYYILQDYFNNDVYEMLNYYNKIDEISNKLKIDVENLISFIKENNKMIYTKCSPY